MGRQHVPRRQPTPPERSPEERARAAAERAARRGESSPPPETFIARNARPPEPAAPSEDPFRVERARPEPEPDPEPLGEGSWFDEDPEPEREPEREAMPDDPFPQATQEFHPAWVEEDDAVEWEVPEHVPPDPEPEAVSQEPAQQGRFRAAPRRELPPRGPRSPLTTQRSPNGRRPAGTPRHRFPRRILAVVALALIGGALWLINATFQPFHDDPTGAVVVTVPPGADAGQIGKLLQAAGVVDSAKLFEANATVTLRRSKLRPGKYTLPKGMTNGGAIEALMQGPKARVVKTFKFTLPEGQSRHENVALVKKGPFTGDYLKATTDKAFLRRAHGLGLPKSSKNLEGFLFPATYEMISGASAKDLVKRQLDAYQQSVGKVSMKAARKKNLTRYDVLIIASMVEREAQLAKERPLIAAVIYNRLHEGIPLGIDATIRYQINNWSRPLRVSELQRDTPYNTRTRRGLPPTPIGNPGLSSIKAAANPAKSKYLFFVRKPGKTGEHAFSKTDAQFERDVARYQASRGGP
jgi:peptidoglycan lytic transglycosylase G